MRVVIDTNVVVSGLLFGGVPGQLISLWRSRVIKPCIAREILDEDLRVFSYPRFALTETEIQYLVYKQILPYFEVAQLPLVQPIGISQDPSDDLFLYCARAAGASFVITGDRHLLALKSWRKIVMMAPAAFLQIFVRKG
jgi:putative PIN family toxin of toxin-antitoxin system